MVVNLSDRLAANFTNNVRRRGNQYWSQRRVHIEEGSASSLSALVQGSQTYAVGLNVSDESLSAQCECPYFVGGGVPCKHIWAALLAGEERGYLSAAGSVEDLQLNPGDYGFEDEIDYEAVPVRPVAARPSAHFRNLTASNQP